MQKSCYVFKDAQEVKVFVYVHESITQFKVRHTGTTLINYQLKA